MFIGEAPGKVEERQGTIFVGKTGEEVDRHYLPVAGLRRDAVTFTNAISCLPITAGGKLDPTRQKDLDLLYSCAESRLYPLIEQMRPRVVVPMGQFACRALFGEAFDLELRHGIPTDSPFGPAFPMYHPAMGLHEPKKMLYVRTDWDRLGKYLKDTLLVPVDEYPNPDYREVTDARELAELDPTLPLAADTESSREGPYCFTYSQSPGSGRLLRADRVDLLSALQTSLDRWESEILFHNWLYDWPVTEAMALRIPHRRVVDTMARVYHLGNLPQGLKALSFRELGMEMQDFDDLVAPYSREVVLDYFRDAALEVWDKPEAQTVREPDGRWKLYQPQRLNTKLKRFFTDLRKAPDKDVFGMWENWGSDHAAVTQILGAYPGKDIRHVPFEKTLFYACRDSDALIRLWPLLKRMSTMTRRYSQEKWREKAA